MKPPAFAYHAPATLGEALEVLAEVGASAKVLAGGQSLIPLLNMRLAAPEHVIDINRLAELDTLSVTMDGVRIGALARHARVERSDESYAVQPLLRQALRLVAHPVIRNRGTVAGSIAHADPASELPAVLTLLGGSVELVRRGGSRTVAGTEFFTGPLETSLAPDEMVGSVFFPALAPHAGTAFAEIARRHGDYALAGVAAHVSLDDDLRISSARVACISVGPTPVVLDLTQACGHRPSGSVDWHSVAGAARELVQPDEDIHASAAYRRHLVGVLTERALRLAAEEATHA